MKKIVSRALAVLLCMALLCTGTAFTAPDGPGHEHTRTRPGVLLSSGTETGCDHQWDGGYWEITNDCRYDYVETFKQTCTICGYVQSTAYRPRGNVKGDHNYVAQTLQDATCSGRYYTRYTCSVCGSSYEEGAHGHQWGSWVAAGSGCTDPDVRTCSLCGATENRNANRVHVWGEIQREGSCASGWTLYHVCRTCGARENTGSVAGHAWESFNEPSDCTHTGRSGQRCAYCGAEQNVTTIPVSHSPSADDGDCRTAVTCVRCGAVVTPARSAHNFGGGWKSDGESHWQVCQNPGCKAVSGASAHKIQASKDCTQPAYCSVCGAKSGAAPYASHDFTGDYVIASTTYHTRKCAHPGCGVVSVRESHQMPAGDFPCTETVRCVCGYPMRQGQSAHDYGPWTVSGSGHSRTCRKCGYVQSGSHTGSSKGSCTSAVKCTVCGQVLVHAFSSHSYGVWIAAANGTGHYRTCTRAGCTVIESTSHSGGTATCKSPAVCSACGASYGSRSTTNHTGGTELRGAKPAAVGAEGYTGDTVCLGCGDVIKKGKTIPALAEDHEHAFSGAWSSDSVQHWHACACGERSGAVRHSFSNGVCIVCGAKDPDHRVCSGSLHVGGKQIRDAKPAAVGSDGYTGDVYCTACKGLIASGTVIPALAKDHVHNYSAGWKSDSASHWHECNCGAQAAKASHIYGANGRCAFCGAPDPTAGNVPAHVHTYGALVSNGQDHWRECSICGEQADRAHHMILDGKCMDCGYVKVDASSFKDLDESDWYFDSVRLVTETGLIADLEGGRFQPETPVERGRMADILYRMAGSPASDGSSGFEDVSDEEDYVNAVSWAAGNSIMEGEDDAFNPEQSATVEQLAAGLWRYAAMLDTEGGTAELEVMEWAEQIGLMDGYEQLPDPAAEATRADVAVLVANFMRSMELLSEQSPADMV